MIGKILFSFLIVFYAGNAFSASLVDSIGVESLDGKKIIIHKIQPKETYYAIGRKYNVSPSKIIDFNGNITLHPGDVIRIPTTENYATKPVTFSSPVKDTKATAKQATHSVAAGETLYAVASQYNMRVDDLKLLNSLNSNNLSVGQVLKVVSQKEVSSSRTVEKNAAGKPVVIEKKPIETASSVNKIKYIDSTDSQNNINIPKNRYGITEMNDKGLAVWIDDNNLDATKSYALHSVAPVGTIIKITNPMTNRSVFAKVVGRYTENATTKDVIIVVTKSCADAIGALDKRFLVNITFGLPNEGQ